MFLEEGGGRVQEEQRQRAVENSALHIINGDKCETQMIRARDAQLTITFVNQPQLKDDYLRRHKDTDDNYLLTFFVECERSNFQSGTVHELSLFIIVRKFSEYPTGDRHGLSQSLETSF